MKAKAFYNKLLAIVLTIVLVALSVPTAIFMVGASGEVPTVDATTDIGKYVNFYDNQATFKEYDTTGSLKTNASTFKVYGANYTENGTYYASVKMTFDEYFEWQFVKNEETGKWERGSGNAGIVWGQTGFQIGTYVTGSGQTQLLSLVYRRGQQGFYVMDPNGNSVIASGISGVGKCDVVELIAKYDSTNKSMTVWFNGDNGRVVKTSTIDMSAVNEFQFTGFDLRCGNGGAHPEDLNDITNETTIKNNVVFSDLHLWGDVSTTKHYMAPSIGNATNIADTLTLSDSTLNADWKADGSFTWNFSNTYFNGLTFAENTIVYASVTLSNIAKGSGGSDIYGVAFAKDGDKNAFSYLRPQWNQQGAAGTNNVSLASTDGWGVAGTDGSLASWDGTNEQVFIYAFDVNAKTVDVWRRTSVYQSHWANIYSAPYQDIYVGKFSLSSKDIMALGLVVGSNANVSSFNKNVNVSDVQVWVEQVSAPVTPPPPVEEGEEGEFSLDDTTLNAEYNENGEIVIDSTTGTVFLKGINVVYGIGQKITYSFDMKYSRAPQDDLVTNAKVNPIMVYAAKKDGTIAGYGPNPSWNHTSNVGGVTVSNSIFGTTGSFSKGTTAKQTYKVVYDVDNGTVELWANTQRIASCYADGEMLMGKATLDNGFAFKPGISGNEITGGTATVSNIKVEYSSATSTDTTNRVGNFNAYEGGFLDTGIAYNNVTDLGVSNVPVWTEGTTLNNTGIFTSLKTGGYDGKNTIVWKGNREGDLNEGIIIYQADFTVYNKTTGWNGTNWGFVVAKVDGHYVTTGLGVHGAAGANYKNMTAIDGSNIGEQAGANGTFLGAPAVGNIVVAGTEAGTTVTITAVLTATSLTTYIDGVKGQTFDFTGKTVEPMFAFAWGSGNENDKISNVKFMGDGIVEIPCEHSYSYPCDTECNFCKETREIEDYLHEYNDGCATLCKYCGVERDFAPLDHEYSSECDATCDNCGETREVDANLHVFDNACDDSCNICGATRPSQHTYSSLCDVECDVCGAVRTALENHTFDNASDAFCNGCNAERIALNALKKSGTLLTLFNEQLASSAPVFGTSFDLNPAQAATQSISLGGAIFDISKGYTISADFTVKTNVNMESHFGITAFSIGNDEQYTFGVLANGNWGAVNTPTQAYHPYIRRGNGNQKLVGATGSSVTATDEGATINIKVVVTATSATYYLNNVEAKTIDLTGKDVTPYAALTSRGANVTVSNIQFYGAGVKNHASHNFDSACDAICDDCYAVREAAAHKYDNDTCDADCNTCGGIREVTHVYSFVCDDICDVCETKRNVTHTFTDGCDETCDVTGCTATRTAPHAYSNDCDKDCDLCGKIRYVNKHIYTNGNDLECDRCGYTRPDYAFGGMADHTADMFLNNKVYRDGLKADGSFVMADKMTTTDNALTVGNSGKIVAEAKLTFQGNVDFLWQYDAGEGKYKYNNAWGKVGIKIGTYFNEERNATQNIFVAFRRCTAHAYLFDDGNTLLGDFGSAALSDAESIKMTYLYDIAAGEVHLWIDGSYVGVVRVSHLKDFEFAVGFGTQGLGNTAVDDTDVNNGETVNNLVTVSEVRLLGDYVKNPLFELPATEHTHEYSNANDLICNTCGAEKIKFATLKRNGNLFVNFTEELQNSAPVTGTSFNLNPAAFATQSIVLGGATYDFNKGGYVISADFTVKTNSSMESHFGITAITINNEPYTFGMLSNGNWNTPDGNVPTQVYTPYGRKNNNNSLLGATGDKVTATDEGVKVNILVDVNDSRVIYYINGTEALKIDLTGKTVAPYVALTSRGANVTVSNIQFTGVGVTNCAEHKYSGACDGICDICYGGVRDAKAHTYDDETCDTTCNECGTVREVPHVRVHDCDTKCTKCGTAIAALAAHVFDDNCDETCNVCEVKRTAPHSYTNDCDTSCDLCGKTRFVNKHVYDDETDLKCNVCGYKRPAYNFDSLADHTDELFLNNKEYRDSLASKGKFTMGEKLVTNDNALITKTKGQVVVSADLKFNGNVDFTWKDTNEDGEYKYELNYGKVGIKVGTYHNETYGSTQNVFVSFRRGTAHAYLFDDGNTLLGDFGAAASMTAEKIKMTISYDIKTGEIHLWIDDMYVGVATVANLKDFKFTIGFGTQGLGNTAVDEEDVNNGETKDNTVTFSNIKVLGAVKVDPLFELPAVEHTHEYSDANDLICNTCGAEKIKFATLKRTGNLFVNFTEELQNSAPVTGTSIGLSPAAYGTNSIVLGGANYDFSKGGYVISADFTVKTNSNLESHFGITALTINNEPYTFGMLANGDWSTTPASVIQVYTPYVRKNNNNDLLSATGDKFTATDKGVKVSLTVDVNDSRAIFYINGSEARVIDLTDKTVAPYVALTSRGANVTISNIQFNGTGVSNCEEHKYSGACDAICDECYGGIRKAKAHAYDDETCDTTCNVCGTVREVPHVYAHDCDNKCSACGANVPAKAAHVFDDDCDETCNVCEVKRTAPHSYTNDCDVTCDLCGKTRFVNKHVYDDEADLKCNVCGYKRPAYKFDGMADHTDDLFLNNKEFRDGLATKGKFTMPDGLVTKDSALTTKTKGSVAVSANIKFNGNVDFTWKDTNEDGEYKYELNYGKVSIMIGTYFNEERNSTQNVFVSFRRGTAHAYLFDDGNTLLGDFGSAASMTAEKIKMTFIYDIKTGEIHLWIDDMYVGVATVAKLKDFKFGLGFGTQGIGNTAVDAEDVKNSETKANTVTFSNVKVLGDLKIDPLFELPATEHTHEYSNDKDLICNTCGAEKIKFTALKNPGSLQVKFYDELQNSAPVTGTSFNLNPAQFATNSIVLGGAIYDFSKGGYTISADFTVKTNSSMESHFGITALTINNEPYTFGMLSNGNWNTPDGNVPTQTYTPYGRKNNNNSLLGAIGSQITATDKGVKVNLFVDVNDARVIFYINGSEALKIDLTGKTVAPYVALTSRGANVTVSNIQFNGKGVSNCTDHKYSGACDAICDECFGGVRKAKAHTYDDKTCDTTCNVCGTIREVSHVRTHDCDTNCTKCGAGIAQKAPHKFTNDCDDTCDVCEAKRTPPHVYDHDCDTKCNECGTTRYVNKHLYDDDNDLECNRCGYVRPAYPKVKGMKNHTSNYHINQKDYRESLKKDGKFTITGDASTSGGGLLVKDGGQVVITTDIQFNGNVDYVWKDTNEDGEYKYELSYGKVGIKVGTYFDTDSNSTQNVYVSFRRCSAHIYLFNDGNKVLGDFGPAASTTVEKMNMTVLYDSAKNEVSVWVDGKYINTCTLSRLEKFKFNTGFVTQGVGNSAADPDDVTNGEKTTNSVTFSNFKIYGDLKKDTEFVPESIIVSPPAGSLEAPNPKDYKDFTSDFHLDDGKLDKELINKGKFTATGNNTRITGAGVLFKSKGNAYVSFKMKFNGNVDFYWTEKTVVDPKTGEKVGTGEYEYTNGWGKYGLQIGTYTSVNKDADGNVISETKNLPVYVSFRRCTGSFYLFDSGNKVLGSFGSYGTPTIEEIKITVMYDAENKMVYLWADDYFVKALPVSGLKDFNTSLGFVIQGTGTTAVDPTNPKNSKTTENSVTFSDIKVFGDFEKDPNFYVPELEPMKDNLAKYIELRKSGNSAAYFERKFSGSAGSTYDFIGLKYDPTNAKYNVSFDYVITERNKDANGNDVSWGSIRFGVMEAAGFKYQLSTLPNSTNLLANGGGYAGYSAPTFSRGSKVGEKHNIAIQYDFAKNHMSVWFDGELVLRAVELPATDNESRKMLFSVTFEACAGEISDLKMWGTGMTVEASEEYMALMNDPIYTSTVLPAKPEGNINYWAYISGRNQTGDLGFDMINDEFSNYWSDEQGRIIFRDSYGNRNLNGITNDTTFVARFKYKVTEEDPAYVEANKQRGSIFTVRGYNLPTSQGKKNNYQIAFYNNEIKISVLKDDAVVTSASTAWKREVGKEYDIAIVSASSWVKIFIDGKLVTAMGGLYQYTFDFCYESVHVCAEFWDMQLYDAEPNEAKEPVKNNAPSAQPTGTTVNTIEHSNVPLATGTMSIWMILTLLGAVLCLAGAAVMTVVFIKKKKENQ